MRENELANHICHWLLRWGALCWINDSVGIYDAKSHSFRANRNPYRIRGTADIIGITGANWSIATSPRPLAVEVKMPGGRQSEDQKEFEKRWVLHGGVYVLAHSLLDVKTALGLPDTIEWPKTAD
jgi:hypothetical protein